MKNFTIEKSKIDIRARLKNDGPCEECLVKITCRDTCDSAWKHHLRKASKLMKIDPTMGDEVYNCVGVV